MRPKVWATSILLATVAGVAIWSWTYGNGDPKNIRYVLWKHDLWHLNPDLALGTMVGDSKRDQLILGRTKDELKERFGYLSSPGEASEYYRSAYLAGPYKDKEVGFLRRSAWMVVFDRGRATDLVLIKGW